MIGIRLKDQRGYTVVELIFTLGILGIVLLIVSLILYLLTHLG
jgi:prepilin-type N-terminal cleavage/methylation domain-containing protein